MALVLTLVHCRTLKMHGAGPIFKNLGLNPLHLLIEEMQALSKIQERIQFVLITLYNFICQLNSVYMVYNHQSSPPPWCPVLYSSADSNTLASSTTTPPLARTNNLMKGS